MCSLRRNHTHRLEAMILLLCDDLIFTSKVTATARAVGVPVSVARTTIGLLAKVEAQPPACVILDLHNPTLLVSELLPQLRAAVPAVHVVGFGSHVDVIALKAARAAGCHEVLPRSQFAEELETRLPGWAATS